MNPINLELRHDSVLPLRRHGGLLLDFVGGHGDVFRSLRILLFLSRAIIVGGIAMRGSKVEEVHLTNLESSSEEELSSFSSFLKTWLALYRWFWMACSSLQDDSQGIKFLFTM